MSFMRAPTGLIGSIIGSIIVLLLSRIFAARRARRHL